MPRALLILPAVETQLARGPLNVSRGAWQAPDKTRQEGGCGKAHVTGQMGGFEHADSRREGRHGRGVGWSFLSLFALLCFTAAAYSSSDS